MIKFGVIQEGGGLSHQSKLDHQHKKGEGKAYKLDNTFFNIKMYFVLLLHE